MSMWHPDPPQGFSKSQSQVIIGRPMIPLYGAPQGIGGVAPPIGDSALVQTTTLSALVQTGTLSALVNGGE